jgi:hypothetical protein
MPTSNPIPNANAPTNIEVTNTPRPEKISEAVMVPQMMYLTVALDESIVKRVCELWIDKTVNRRQRGASS